MSKSLGNVLLVRDLLAEAPGEAIRYALLSAHYRQPLDWSAQGLQQARRSLDRLYGTLRSLQDVDADNDPSPYLDAFHAALDDDLNTPAAFAELFRLARMAQHETAPAIRSKLKAAIIGAGADLGLLQQHPDKWFQQVAAAPKDIDVGQVEALIAKRSAARAARAFQEADQLREQIEALGVTLEDRGKQTEWRRAVP